MAKDNWFAVDRKGMAQVLARRSKAAAIFELISNAWDAPGVTEVNVYLRAVEGRALVDLSVVDNSPEGFLDLEEARTLFAPSRKKSDPTQRGRFNLGEKLFLALCTEARITSMRGSLIFSEDGSVSRSRQFREIGTEVSARLRMTRAELAEADGELSNLVSPAGIVTRIAMRFGDGVQDVDVTQLAPVRPEVVFTAALPTELAGADGELRPTVRQTEVQVWRADVGRLYEMGIPVVEIEGSLSFNVMQKIPLTIDRENVKPAFLRRVRVEALNARPALVREKNEAEEVWVTEALGSSNPRPTSDLIEYVMDLRFGKKRVSYDPSDVEGSQLAMSKGYTVVSGGALPREVWTNVRESEAIKPAGQVTPSNRVQFSATGKDVTVDPAKVPGAPEVIEAFRRIGEMLLGFPGDLRVDLLNDPRNYGACYGKRMLHLNLRRLGRAWFRTALDDGRLGKDHLKLLVHELGHDYAESHLDEGFHKSQTELGVVLALLVAEHGPDLLQLELSEVWP
jgi:hypothetical protein